MLKTSDIKMSDIKIPNIRKDVLAGTAVYIADDFIDIVKANVLLKGIRVTQLERHPLSKNIGSMSYAEAREEIDSVLNKVFGEEQPFRIAVNLRTIDFILRRFSIREIPKNEMRAAVAFEVQKYIPYTVDEVSFNFKICATTDKFHEIVFGAVEISRLNELIDYFGQKKVFPSIIEPAPVLLSRILNLENNIEVEKVYVNLHYEPKDKVVITGIWRKQPYFVREITIPPEQTETVPEGGEITTEGTETLPDESSPTAGEEEIMRKVDEEKKDKVEGEVPPTETAARRILNELVDKGISEQGETKPSETVEGLETADVTPEEKQSPTEEADKKPPEFTYPCLEDVWGRIERDVLATVEYLRKETKRNIDKIFISGFTFSREEENISRNFEITFARTATFLFKGMQVENEDRFLPALSLMYDTLHGPFLSLAPTKLAQRDLCAYRQVAVSGVLFLCGVILIHMFFAGINSVQARKIKGVSKEIAAYGFTGGAASTSSLERKKNATAGRYAFVNDVVSKRIFLTEKLNRFAKVITPHAWVNTVVFTNAIISNKGNKLTITGALYVSPEKGVAEINDILEKIKNDKEIMNEFREVQLVSATTKEFVNIEIIEFEIVLR